MKLAEHYSMPIITFIDTLELTPLERRKGGNLKLWKNIIL